MKNVKMLWSAAAALFIVWLYAFGCSLIIQGDISWYVSLNKPSFAPQPWVLGLVWSFVYILYVVIIARTVYKRKNNAVLGAFLTGLALNIIFVIMFFGLEIFFPALIFMYAALGTWVVILWMVARTDKTAFVLSIPTFIWLVFLGILMQVIYFLS